MGIQEYVSQIPNPPLKLSMDGVSGVCAGSPLLYEPYSKPPQVDRLSKLRLRANSGEGTRQNTLVPSVEERPLW